MWRRCGAMWRWRSQMHGRMWRRGRNRRMMRGRRRCSQMFDWFRCGYRSGHVRRRSRTFSSPGRLWSGRTLQLSTRCNAASRQARCAGQLGSRRRRLRSGASTRISRIESSFIPPEWRSSPFGAAGTRRLDATGRSRSTEYCRARFWSCSRRCTSSQKLHTRSDRWLWKIRRSRIFSDKLGPKFAFGF